MLKEDDNKLKKHKVCKKPSTISKAESFAPQEMDMDAEAPLPNNKKRIIIVIAVLSLLFLGGLVTMIILLTRPYTFQIDTLKIEANNETLENEIDVYILEDEIQFKVIVNNDINAIPSKITWEFLGDNLNCAINDNGLCLIGDTLGSTIVKVTATSQNSVSKEIKLNILLPEALTLVDIESLIPSEGMQFVEGQTFNSEGLKVKATFSGAGENVEFYITEYNYDSVTKLVPQDNMWEISYEAKEVSKSVFIPIVVSSKSLQGIEITSAPNTTEYIEGQTLDIDGLKVKAVYEYCEAQIDDFVITNIDIPLTTQDLDFTISYTMDGVTKTAKQSILVRPKTLQQLCIESQPNKLHYVQGQYFKKEGLKLIAKYEYCEQDVTDLVTFDLTGRLCVQDECVNFIFKDGDVELEGAINIVVEPPYKEVRKIIFENPYDATLSWLYEYMTEDGIVNIDDTEYANHDILKFDQENGEYIVPIGARITLYKVNPSLIGFKINGKELRFVYPATTIDFELEFGEENLDINFIKTLGDKITIRFSNENIEQNFVFSYDYGYSGTLSEADLAQVSQIFSETQDEYYIYSIGKSQYTFAELSSLNFDSDTIIVVEKLKRESQEVVTLNIVYPQTTISTSVNKASCLSLKALPQKTRVGYRLDFSLHEGGEVLNDDTFVEWINTAVDGASLYAIYTLIADEVTGEIVGEYSVEDVGNDYALNLKLNSNGTYSYILIKDDLQNCAFSGVYRDDQTGTYTILSVEMESQHVLISTSDFQISLNEDGTLSTTAFIIDWDNLSVEKISTNLTKN